MKLRSILLTAALVAAAAVPGRAAGLGVALIVQLEDPAILVTAPAGDPRLFVGDRAGHVWIIENGQRLATPFLDVSGNVSLNGEQGFLGLAFHPNYRSNGRLFVNYTDLAGTTQIVEYRAQGNTAAAARTILSIPNPTATHHAGWIGFGPDGYLYIATGDGEFSRETADPRRVAQDPGNLFAKILRIDVDRGSPYAIPAGNPFGNETFFWGLRNPWRASFDGNRLYIADVGWHFNEEINVVALSEAGANFGWPIYEANNCLGNCETPGLTAPVHTYRHGLVACGAVIGGYVYRGTLIPELQGQYVFGDLCGGWVHSFRYDVSTRSAGPVTDWTAQIGGEIAGIISFGQDAAGELYITTADGRVYRIVPR
jgi:glucose/arabinose dehydrogenase